MAYVHDSTKWRRSDDATKGKTHSMMDKDETSLKLQIVVEVEGVRVEMPK